MNAKWGFNNEPETEVRPNGHNRQDPPEEWPEPVDILADPQLTGVASVDASCLPNSMLAFAVAEGARLQVDPCHIAALCIGTCSAVISDNWKVRLKVNDHRWIQHPSVWVAVVAESGRKKTDTFKSALSGIAQIERGLRAEYNKKLAQYVEQHKTWEALPKKERGQEPKPPAEVSRAVQFYDFGRP